jgi:hypothetical protein
MHYLQLYNAWWGGELAYTLRLFVQRNQETESKEIKHPKPHGSLNHIFAAKSYRKEISER